MSAYLVGLTGGIGSGKSTVADLFAAEGIEVVDTDRIAHALTAAQGAAIPDIAAAFGKEVLTPEGALDRTAMRKRVFEQPDARARLEGMLHPMIERLALKQLRRATSPYAIAAVPLLAETGYWRAHCDRIAVVDCPPELQIARVMARNGLARHEVEAILAAQASREARLAIADDVIVNAGAPAELEPRVRALHAMYLTASSSKNLHAYH